MSSRLSVLALTVRPEEAPDTRYRILQYVEPLRAEGIDVLHRSLLSPRTWRAQVDGGDAVRLAAGFAAGYARRLRDILALARSCDVVWIGRELCPLGPPLLERLLFSVNPRVVLDIDDAVFLHDGTCKGILHHRGRDFGKFFRLAPRYSAVVCGNRFLSGHFSAYTTNVFVIPTVVPMSRFGPLAPQPAPRPRIGWIGTPYSGAHLELLAEAMPVLARRHDFELRVVGLGRPLAWPGVRVVDVAWSLREELDFFRTFDIGVMPLRDSPFSRGKCAFKLIQYMAAGLPVVASPVGANLDVVIDGKNGFFADSAREWTDRLDRLLSDAELRRSMGENARETVRAAFSLEAHVPGYAGILRRAHRHA